MFTLSGLSSGGPASKHVSCYFRHTKPSYSCDGTSKQDHISVETPVAFYDNLQWSKQRKHHELIQSILQRSSGHSYKRAIHCIAIDVQLLLHNRAAQENQCVKIKAYLEHSRHTHLMWHIYFGLAVFEHQPQETRTVR